MDEVIRTADRLTEKYKSALKEYEIAQKKLALARQELFAEVDRLWISGKLPDGMLKGRGLFIDAQTRRISRWNDAITQTD